MYTSLSTNYDHITTRVQLITVTDLYREKNKFVLGLFVNA